MKAIYSLLLAQLLLLRASAQLQCYVAGQCSGIVVDFPTTETYNICLETCKTTTNCNWVTYYVDTQECVLLYDCPLQEATCTNCFSSQVECAPKEPECHEQGICNGHLVMADRTETANECLELCQATEECQWYSWNRDTQNCVLTEDCLFHDDSCTSCLYREKACQVEPAMLQLFIVGGSPSTVYRKVEVVDLSGQNKTCPDPSNYPAAELWTVGTYIDNKVMVCGGLTGLSYVKRCMNYDPESDSWTEADSMIENRGMAAAVRLSNTKWWITGGYTSDGMTSSTEIYTVGEGFSAYVDLPEANYNHNLVKINDTHVMLLGGHSSTDKAWMFDFGSETWTALPDLAVATSVTHAGLVTHPDGRSAEVVVAAGEDVFDTQVFSLGTMTWRKEEDFPLGELQEGASVQFGDSFLVVGGTVPATGYKKNLDIWEEAAWVQRVEMLAVGRIQFAAFLVPDNYVTCE